MIRKNGQTQIISLRLVLVAVLAAMALIPLATFWVWSSAAAYRGETDAVSDRHVLIARNLGAALSRYHRDVSSAFHILAYNAIAGRPVDAAAGLLQNLAFRHICVAEVASGRVVVSLGTAASLCPATVSPELLDTLLALEPGATVTVTGVMAGPGDEPTIYLLSRYGDLLAIGALSTTYFHELGQAISFGKSGHASIVDQNGRVLSHPRSDWVAERKLLADLPPVAYLMAGRTGISTFQSPAMKADMVAGFAAVPDVGWGVMIPQPLDELRATADESTSKARLVLSLGILAAVALGGLLASRLSAPLHAVTRAAREMAEGDSTARANISNRHFVPHEVHELGSTFNVMAEAVEDAEFEERTARLRADAANKTKSYFLANVSHELRTPLNAIVGFSEMISHEALGKVSPPKYREYATDVLSSATHLRRLIDDLLDISRIEVGEMPLDESDVAVADLLTAAAKMVGQKAHERRVNVDTDDASGATIRVDPGRFGQMLLNLAGNAIRHTPAGGHVRLSAVANDDAVELAVSDTGSGIAKADLRRVQEPFQRGNSSVTRDDDGVGMGLAIVRQLALAHGTEFQIESSPGQGTRAVLRVPQERVVRLRPAPDLKAIAS